MPASGRATLNGVGQSHETDVGATLITFDLGKGSIDEVAVLVTLVGHGSIGLGLGYIELTILEEVLLGGVVNLTIHYLIEED